MTQERRDKDMSRRSSVRLWIAVITSTASIIGVIIQTAGKIDETNRRVIADARAAAAEKKATSLQTALEQRKREIEKYNSRRDTLQKFLVVYITDLTDIRNALSRCREVRSPEAEKQLRESIGLPPNYVPPRIRERTTTSCLFGVGAGPAEAGAEAKQAAAYAAGVA